MSLHQLYNRAVSTAILLLCTVYWTFLLCLQFCFPFLLYESRFLRFCRFSLNFGQLVFYSSEKVVTRITFPAVGLVIAFFISLFITCRVLTSPSFIRIQFKTLKLVCVISSFYIAFVQLSLHPARLNYCYSQTKSSVPPKILSVN